MDAWELMVGLLDPSLTTFVVGAGICLLVGWMIARTGRK